LSFFVSAAPAGYPCTSVAEPLQQQLFTTFHNDAPSNLSMMTPSIKHNPSWSSSDFDDAGIGQTSSNDKDGSDMLAIDKTHDETKNRLT
jgi:hypothetical protein